MSPASVLVASTVSATPVIGLMAFGVILALFGHIGKNYRVVGAGLAALFLATALMMVLGFASYQDDSRDPRKCDPELKGLDCKQR